MGRLEADFNFVGPTAMTIDAERERIAHEGMYRPEFESDACGVGLVAATDGKPSRRVVTAAFLAVATFLVPGAAHAQISSYECRYNAVTKAYRGEKFSCADLLAESVIASEPVIRRANELFIAHFRSISNQVDMTRDPGFSSGLARLLQFMPRMLRPRLTNQIDQNLSREQIEKWIEVYGSNNNATDCDVTCFVVDGRLPIGKYVIEDDLEQLLSSDVLKLGDTIASARQTAESKRAQP